VSVSQLPPHSPVTSSGTLHVVATPIGNLGDLSPRAVQTLRAVAAICAEDTRHSRPLLQQAGVERPLIALHEHNEAAHSAALVARLLAGESLALISDAGTPLISDPGFRLVAAARAAGVPVSPVPGPCALIAALSVAGLASDRFCFEGFLPAKSAARRARIAELANEARTLVFYESAHRIEEALVDLAAELGEARRAVLARELTKRFETVLDGELGSLLSRVQADPDQRRGEFVVVLAGAVDDAEARLASGRRLYARLVRELSPSRAAKLAAELSGAPRQALYAAGE
jgi:16S rRNA (cytidine1402-2'-O)-methyltransferase